MHQDLNLNLAELSRLPPINIVDYVVSHIVVSVRRVGRDVLDVVTFGTCNQISLF